jgi:Tfp pilus assembly protein FimV
MMQAFTKHTEERLSQIESHIQTQSTTTDNLHKSVQSIQAKTESDKAELRAEAEAAKQQAAQENSSQITMLMAQMERMHTLIAQGQQQVAQQLNTAVQAALLPPALPVGQQAPAEGGTPSIPFREHLEAHPPDPPNV